MDTFIVSLGTYLFTPVVFFSLLAALFLLSLVMIVVIFRQNKQLELKKEQIMSENELLKQHLTAVQNSVLRERKSTPEPSAGRNISSSPIGGR